MTKLLRGAVRLRTVPRRVRRVLLARRARWALVGLLAPAVALAGVVAWRPAQPRHTAPASTSAPSAPHSLWDQRQFAAAAARPPAAPRLHRLPAVDLNRLDARGIPRVALVAYQRAAGRLARTAPGCHLSWWLLAGIGYVESNHGHDGGSSRPRWNGVARPPIYGPLLDGSGGWPAVRDTDHGRYDGNTTWDRAVGPMQFLPSTWVGWSADGDGDGRRDPEDIKDAALAAAGYLCAGGGDLRVPSHLAVAVYSYNHSYDYVRLVLTVGARYAGISPATLGVDRLPHDPSPSPTPTATGTSTASPSTSPTTSTANTGTTTTQPSPSPTTSSPRPALPAPTTSPTSPAPLPLLSLSPAPIAP